MPGNRRLFEHALRRATEYNERKQWDKALAEFQNALAEFTEDLDVLEVNEQGLWREYSPEVIKNAEQR